MIKEVEVRKYQINTLGDMEHNENEKCYCSKDVCMKKGVLDLTKCMGVPIFATLPHFFSTDESYLYQVAGLEPSLSKHVTEILLEPVSI